MTASIKTDYDCIKIYLNNLIFLCIRIERLTGFQAWVAGGNKWMIEFYTTSGEILTEQDSEEKWILLLKELDKIEL
jgi:hypothetical protein